MGYAHYTVYRNGTKIEAGYGVEDVCNLADCDKKIDRGLDYLCGATPGGDEHGCGHYFCGGHIFGAPADDVPQLCGACLARWRRERREEFADRLAEAIAAMLGVTKVAVLDDQPFVVVEMEDGRGFTVQVTI